MERHWPLLALNILFFRNKFTDQQAWFAGERIGEGTGRTRRKAQLQAAELSLKNLAGKYIYILLPKLLLSDSV